MPLYVFSGIFVAASKSGRLGVVGSTLDVGELVVMLGVGASSAGCAVAALFSVGD